MIPALLLCVAAAAPAPREVGNLVFDGVPEVPKALSDRLAQYQNTRNATLSDWTASGAMLVLTRFGDTGQVHRVEAPGKYREQLTFFDEPVRGVAADPANPNSLL